MTEEELLNKSSDGNLIPHPHMSEDEKAQMFLDECLHNAGIIDQSPFDEDYNPPEACGPGSPLSDQTTKG